MTRINPLRSVVHLLQVPTVLAYPIRGILEDNSSQDNFRLLMPFRANLSGLSAAFFIKSPLIVLSVKLRFLSIYLFRLGYMNLILFTPEFWCLPHASFSGISCRVDLNVLFYTTRRACEDPPILPPQAAARGAPDADLFSKHLHIFYGMFPALLSKPVSDVSSLPHGHGMIRFLVPPIPAGSGKFGNIDCPGFFFLNKTVQLFIDITVKLFCQPVIPVRVYLSSRMSMDVLQIIEVLIPHPV